MFNKRYKHKAEHKSPRKGQSTVEYIILVTAVIGVAIAFLMNGPFKTTMNQSLTDATGQITNMTGRLTASTALAPADKHSSTPTVSVNANSGACEAGKSLDAKTGACV